jgi:hypothetical protein
MDALVHIKDHLEVARLLAEHAGHDALVRLIESAVRAAELMEDVPVERAREPLPVSGSIH